MNYKAAKIKQLIDNGYKFSEVRKRFPKTNLELIKKTYRKSNLKDVVGVCFGSKTSSYFTEKEMLNGYQIPTLEEVISELK